MPTSTIGAPGRLGNQIIRNLFISIIAKNNNLKVIYNKTDTYYQNQTYYTNQEKLGIKLFSGTNDYNTTLIVNDGNILNYINKNDIKSNIGFNGNVYFQTKECSNFIYNYIHNTLINDLIDANIYKIRYNNNDDVFVHIRLGDVIEFNPGFNYYNNILKEFKDKKIYIATDSPSYPLILELLKTFDNIYILDYDEVNTIQFGSTCKHIVLSHGSFSAIIGYFAFYSTEYYPEYDKSKQLWYGDLFSIQGWNMIKYL
jgi:hypothetical protein